VDEPARSGPPGGPRSGRSFGPGAYHPLLRIAWVPAIHGRHLSLRCGPRFRRAQVKSDLLQGGESGEEVEVPGRIADRPVSEASLVIARKAGQRRAPDSDFVACRLLEAAGAREESRLPWGTARPRRPSPYGRQRVEDT
jgi:hypothetical protein